METETKRKIKNGYVYLIVQREFLRSGELVCKCGRAVDVLKRFKQYPKGSKLLYVVYCNDMIEGETKALALLGMMFKQRKDIGKKSFEGDFASMIGALCNLICSHSSLLLDEKVDVIDESAQRADRRSRVPKK